MSEKWIESNWSAMNSNQCYSDIVCGNQRFFTNEVDKNDGELFSTSFCTESRCASFWCLKCWTILFKNVPKNIKIQDYHPSTILGLGWWALRFQHVQKPTQNHDPSERTQSGEETRHRRRNHGGDIIKEESWRRNHEGGVMKEESWRRNHERGIMEEESCSRNKGGGIMKEE